MLGWVAFFFHLVRNLSFKKSSIYAEYSQNRCYRAYLDWSQHLSKDRVIQGHFEKTRVQLVILAVDQVYNFF